ncbi:hypothetical protein AX14_013807 [Amanita brunnescens Koide BX004]|nr:hypothetical protein AX14_013807 [Amanita brunnescens Koide BX004]
MYGPTAQVKKIYEQIQGHKALPSPLNGYYAFPCDNMPKISFRWGGKKEWKINEEDFNLGPVSKGSKMCAGALVAQDMANDVWLLGDTLMMSVYTAFDMDKKTVGFGQLKSH